MQCRRVRLPLVAPLTDVAEVCARDGVMMADRRGVPPALAHPAIVVGPEGGFTADELGSRPLVALADLVLRGETAAIAAGVLLTALRAGMVRSADPSGQGHARR
jgi:16S rRNA U1498 N3-methylase RsmE